MLKFKKITRMANNLKKCKVSAGSKFINIYSKASKFKGNTFVHSYWLYVCMYVCVWEYVRVENKATKLI